MVVVLLILFYVCSLLRVIYKRAASSCFREEAEDVNCFESQNFIVQVYAANVAALEGNALKIVGVNPLKKIRQPSSRYECLIQSTKPLYLSGSDWILVLTTSITIM